MYADSWYKKFGYKFNVDDQQKKPEFEAEINRFKRFISKNSSVLDIGAGLGRLAVPLAKEVRKLTAIEPARAYMNIMKDKAARDGLDNMEFSDDLWADFPLQKKYDLVCSTWSRAAMDPASLMKMHEASRGHCALEFVASPSNNNDFEQLYAMIMGEEYRYSGNYLNIITTLYDNEIYANLETWKYDTVASYQNIEDFVEMRRIGFEAYTHVTDEMVEQFRQFYKARMNPDGTYSYPTKGVACMIWWKV
ncbi:MAG: class I SAM-dependent methyltransferase [Methanothrix sp.]|jgi:SAM-dependent methyltransferase|uniref:class I SAM-dependent methyltransferase n=1 Tax=Methanothrix sp. TaxID=90426 RepID=UPI0025E3FC27|nr:class I SAM-dependent methyltransferase [Methanothrix sp.]MCK9405384.1 class I SAM-dependent methyltransferase [Methanothrix sp.]